MILNTSFCDSSSNFTNANRSPSPSLPLSQFRATAAMGVIWSRNTSTKSFDCGFSSKVKGSEQMNHKSAYVFSQRAEEVAVEDEVAVMPETAPSLKSIPGLPNPLGVSEIDNGINFALFSQHATSVTLCLSLPDREIDASPNGGMIELKLDPCANKTGDIWHICVQELPRSNVIYGYKIDGPQNWHQGHRFDNSVVLIDPYAKILEGRRIFGNSTEKFSKHYGTYDFSSLPFDWGDNYAQPNIAEKDLVIYEMNVRAFTADKSSGLEQTIRGSYRGVIDKIPHLLELGVNAVELLPVFEFDEFEFQRRPNPRDHMVH